MAALVVERLVVIAVVSAAANQHAIPLGALVDIAIASNAAGQTHQ